MSVILYLLHLCLLFHVYIFWNLFPGSSSARTGTAIPSWHIRGFYAGRPVSTHHHALPPASSGLLPLPTSVLQYQVAPSRLGPTALVVTAEEPGPRIEHHFNNGKDREPRPGKYGTRDFAIALIILVLLPESVMILMWLKYPGMQNLYLVIWGLRSNHSLCYYTQTYLLRFCFV